MTSEHPADTGGVVSAVRTLFGFLDERGSSVEVEHCGDRTVIAYLNDPAAFEVELDWRERAAFVLVARTVKGHRPPGYYVSEGKRVRVQLIEALRKAGLLTPSMERRLKDVMSASDQDAMLTQLRVLATELRNNLEPLLGRMTVVFS